MIVAKMQWTCIKCRKKAEQSVDDVLGPFIIFTCSCSYAMFAGEMRDAKRTEVKKK